MTTLENVDPVEIQKFEDMARRWWDPLSEFKPLHAINPLRMTYIAERAELAGKHHEIYLADIRRAKPTNWKTIIRQPMA